MQDRTENPYEDFGRSIAGAVLEGHQSRAWALEIIKMLGYDSKDLDEWLTLYKRENYQSLRWQSIKKDRRRQRISRLIEKAKDFMKEHGHGP